MIISIENEEYLLKYTIRSLFVYEQITGATFTPDKLLNEYTFMYSVLMANNENFNLQFDEFIVKCDNDENLFLTFRKWLLNVLKQKALLQVEEQNLDNEDKKKD